MLVETIITLLQEGRSVDLKMLSGSMRPLLPADAMITIDDLDGRRPRPGWIVVFTRGETLVAHRVLLRGPGGAVYQKGDNNPTGGWLRAERLVGRVTAVVHPDGTHLALDTPEADEIGRKAANESLRGDLKARLRSIPERIGQWLSSGRRNSG